MIAYSIGSPPSMWRSGNDLAALLMVVLYHTVAQYVNSCFAGMIEKVGKSLRRYTPALFCLRRIGKKRKKSGKNFAFAVV